MRLRCVSLWMVCWAFLTQAPALAETYVWEALWRVDADFRMTKEYRFRAEGPGVRDRLERWRRVGEDWPWTFWEGLLPSLEGSDRRLERSAESTRAEAGQETVAARWRFEGPGLSLARRESPQWVFYPPPLDEPAMAASMGAGRSRWKYLQREVHVKTSWRVEAPGPREPVARDERTFGGPGLEAKVALRALGSGELPAGSVGWEWVNEVWLRETPLSQKDIAAQWAAYRGWFGERVSPILWKAERRLQASQEKGR